MDGAAPACRHMGAVRLGHVDEDDVAGTQPCDAAAGGELGVAIEIHHHLVVIQAAAGDMHRRAVEPCRAEAAVDENSGGEVRARGAAAEFLRRHGGRHVDEVIGRLAQALQRLLPHAEICRGKPRRPRGTGIAPLGHASPQPSNGAVGVLPPVPHYGGIPAALPGWREGGGCRRMRSSSFGPSRTSGARFARSSG